MGRSEKFSCRRGMEESIRLMQQANRISEFIMNDNCGALIDLIGSDEALLNACPMAFSDASWLHRAAHFGARDCTKWMQEQGLSLELANNQLETPLAIAVMEVRNAPLVVTLLKLGADPHGHPDGCPPLHSVSSVSFQYQPDQVIPALLEHGADIERRYKGRTALMIAAEFGQGNNVQMLLAAGADPLALSEGNEPGLTALDIAQKCGKELAADILRAFMQAQIAHNAVGDVSERQRLSGVRPL